jgi:stage V sporulation protein SpoVS
MSEEISTTESMFPEIPNDPSLLLVKGKNGENKPYIKQLAHAVLTVVAKYGYANLKCVGASSINNGIKAIVIASGEAKQRGVNLVISPSFQEAMFDNVEKTAVMMSVFDR